VYVEDEESFDLPRALDIHRKEKHTKFVREVIAQAVTLSIHLILCVRLRSGRSKIYSAAVLRLKKNEREETVGKGETTYGSL